MIRPVSQAREGVKEGGGSVDLLEALSGRSSNIFTLPKINADSDDLTPLQIAGIGDLN